jgi:hypothetical protein
VKLDTSVLVPAWVGLMQSLSNSPLGLFQSSLESFPQVLSFLIPCSAVTSAHSSKSPKSATSKLSMTFSIIS